ncbi:MAG: 50S ribosomal protein L4 [Lachnospiraceae bacterium]|nr:50S ribosomal protein L4 [Lachnospiraceae bacterium]
MPNVKVFDMAGKEVSELTLSDAIFGAEVNEAVLHTYVRAFLMNQRQGTQSALTRTEVSGGGKKPWKQKGTGRARQGSTRAPQWTHGGVVFAPKPRCYRVTINKKLKRIALISALSDKVASGKLIVVDTIAAEEYKTKTMVNMLNALGAEKKSLVVLADNDPKTVASFANIAGVKTAGVNTLNAYDVLNADTFVVAKAAVEKIEEVFA